MEWFGGDATREGDLVDLAFLVDLDIESFGEGVDAGDADAVEPA